MVLLCHHSILFAATILCHHTNGKVYRESSFPAVSVRADSQPADFLGALLVLIRWVLHKVSTQVLVLKIKVFVMVLRVREVGEIWDAVTSS